jgi:hypothetical protein
MEPFCSVLYSQEPKTFSSRNSDESSQHYRIQFLWNLF